ncbi:MAG: TraB/GumN family protein [Candidatus Hadarchaeales archaeon]
MIKRIGDKLTLVGVGHVLPESIRDVKNTILEEKPDTVALELCPLRYISLRSGAGKKEIPGASLLGWIMYLSQMRFSRQTRIMPGEEMLAAVECAEKTGASIELIDLPVDLTIRRLGERIRTGEKIRLALQLLISFLPSGGGRLRGLTEDDVVKEMLEELKKFSTGIYEVLIEERDRHMASRLDTLLSHGKKVVAVVGAAHVPGIESMLAAGRVRWSSVLEYEVPA